MAIVALGLPLASTAIGEQLSDRAIAEQILATMGSSSAERTMARAPLDESKHALERAAGARRSGDARHAEQLEGLAREWAETARDLARAAAAEADAAALELAAADAGVQAERARALLEETIARRGRAEAELAKLSSDAGAVPALAPASSRGARPTKPAKPPEPASSTAPKGTP